MPASKLTEADLKTMRLNGVTPNTYYRRVNKFKWTHQESISTPPRKKYCVDVGSSNLVRSDRERSEPVTTWLFKDDLDRVQRRAVSLSRSRSELMAILIEYALNTIPVSYLENFEQG